MPSNKNLINRSRRFFAVAGFVLIAALSLLLRNTSFHSSAQNEKPTGDEPASEGRVVTPAGKLVIDITPGRWHGKQLVRIDIPNAKSLDLRMPAGNENGANPL